jgi:two-component system OmpR family sensor kinase
VLTAESLSLVIEDDGHGLGAEDLAHVQVGGTVSDQGRTRDLGFGLAIARSLMEAHGGGLRLEAVRDIGARAWLMLPRERLLAGA